MTVIAKRALGTKGDLWAHITGHAEWECCLLLVVNAVPPAMGTSGPVSALLGGRLRFAQSSLPAATSWPVSSPDVPGGSHWDQGWWTSLGLWRGPSSPGEGWGGCAPVGDQPGVGIRWPGWAGTTHRSVILCWAPALVLAPRRLKAQQLLGRLSVASISFKDDVSGSKHPGSFGHHPSVQWVLP